ncbi:MAG: polysaccharide biosynthesis tyrosine autokinase [Chthoniobacteraceae bacterium]|nr:polysaccharide biosynthesis tyrosine autokinase [Chthoniobacteraceae bacterium]
MNDTSEVKLHFLDYWRVIRVRWAILVITFCLVLATAGVTCFFLPRQFYSRVVMEVKPDDNGIDVFGGGEAFRPSRDPNLQPTQFQIIQSKEILYPVIDNLKLVETWSGQEGGNILPKEEAYNRLLGQMKLNTVRNTDLIEIGVFSTDRAEAASIANTVAVVYQTVRRDDQLQIRDAALAQLREEVIAEHKKVDSTQLKMQTIRDRDKIVDPNPESFELNQNTAQNIVNADETRYNELKSRITELKAQLEQTSKLKPEEFMVALPSLDIQDPTISKVLPQLQETTSEDARLLNSGLGENHPRIKALRAQKEVFSKQLSDAIAGVRNSLNIKLGVAEASLPELKTKMEQVKAGLNAANNLSQEYINVKSDYLKSKRVLEEAERRLSTQMVQLKMTVVPAKIWEKAEPAVYPAKPYVLRIMGVAIFIGLFFGVMLAFFIEYLDTSVKTLDDVEHYLKAPVLAVIPKGITSLFKIQGDTADAEAYRILRTNIEFNSRNPNAKTMTLVSGGPGEGKSTTLNNLAVTYAKGGYNVLIVDADLRRPSQHTFFDVDYEVGLTDVLTGARSLEECIIQTSLPNLSFLPSGNLPDDAVGILNSQSMIDLIAAVRNHYDLIFFDSPPILGVSDAAILASEVDIAIMVVQYRRFPRSMLQRVKGAVENVGGHLLGIVLNNVETKHDSSYQYYTQYYDYYTPDAERRKRKPALHGVAGNSAAEPLQPGDY